MKSTTPHQVSIAVVGGGQLGTMLVEAAQPLRVRVQCLDPDPDAPASYNAQSFAEGSLTDPRTVEAFARHADVVTIEIENVSVAGLRRLREDHGRKVYPQPEALEIIQDKGNSEGALPAARHSNSTLPPLRGRREPKERRR